MENNELRNLLSSSLSYSGVKPSDIPELDLYVDQILTIFEQKLSDTRRKDNDKLVTKSMINNYSKEKLITPVRGKKYSKDQILEIMTIFQLKNSLSIEDIKLVMDVIHTDAQITGEVLSNKLTLAESSFTTAIAQDNFEHIIPNSEGTFSADELLGILLTLSKLCFFYKKACENIIDKYFSQTQNP
ncbi:MAG: DUF1836 domain-containing protein [Oscillospiraceae bacterium]